MRLDAHPATDIAGKALGRQARALARWEAVLGAPEAEDRGLLAFGLLLRVDLSPETVVLFLRQAPDLRTAAEVHAWVETIPQQAGTETRQ